ncbi:hypothetical protein [Kitasatospora sp. CB02891]|uniref:hypothetical protein n=1 Tax=Kitasatospora sp. CB02891 TaxID=2020329 RepID=UPI0018E2188A|nr:hypothetical protein [Kitasatospora sp. CB02891]
MTGRERYTRYRDDSGVPAAIGEQLSARIGRVTVRLPRVVAEAAVKAWERDEVGGRATETHEQCTQRDRAAELAFVGLAISERGRREGEGAVVDLDVASAGAASWASQWSAVATGGRPPPSAAAKPGDSAHLEAVPTGNPRSRISASSKC